MTHAAKKFRKQLSDFWKNLETWSYMEELARALQKIGAFPLISLRLSDARLSRIINDCTAEFRMPSTREIG
ncbi:hypothetical protein J5J83_01020 [Azoarcus sp. L1K30]|nr:hypothetical protein [Azoarcus sp. L1K30]